MAVQNKFICCCICDGIYIKYEDIERYVLCVNFKQ